MKTKKFKGLMSALAMTILVIVALTLGAAATSEENMALSTATSEENATLSTTAASEENMALSTTATTSEKAITLGKTALKKDAIVYLGKYTYNYKENRRDKTVTKELPWRVLSTTGNDGSTDKIFLLSEYALEKKAYSVSGGNEGQTNASDWHNSSIYTWLNNDFLNSTNGNFTDDEKGLIQGVTKSSTVASPLTDELKGEKVFLLSKDEYESYCNNAKPKLLNGKSAGSWWLRTPEDSDSDMVYRVYNTNGALYRTRATEEFAVRPAINLQTSDILFTAPAKGGKSGAVGTLVKNEDYTDGEYKITYIHENRKLFTYETTVSGGAGDTLTFNYVCYYYHTKGNKKNIDGYVSAMIVDADDNVLYYGKMTSVDDANSYIKVDTFDMTIPDDLAEGEYTIKFFNEKINGNYKVDCASDFYDVRLIVKSEDNVVLGTSILKGTQRSNVWFGTYEQSSDGNGGYNDDPVRWNVLDTAFKYNGDNQNAILLLSDKLLESHYYHASQKDITWENSGIRYWLNGSFHNTIFSGKEENAVLETKVKNKANKYYPNTPAGNDTTDKLFLLSVDEFENANYFAANGVWSERTEYLSSVTFTSGVGRLEFGTWWLRSPGYTQDYAMRMNVDDVAGGGLENKMVSGYSGVRPAFSLNPASVLFTTAAQGGKADRKGLFKNGVNVGNDYKLTLKDSLLKLTLTDTSKQIVKNGYTRNINYTATYPSSDASKAHISAMIVDANDKVLYYGLLGLASASGNVEYTVPDELSAGTYTVHVFVEVRNGDYVPDYASDFQSFTLEVEKGNLSPRDFTFTPPSNLEYDRDPKAATFTSSKSGVGTITIKYYDEDGKKINGEPIEPGRYTVKIDVAEGTGYKAATDLEDVTWQFTIVRLAELENDVVLGRAALSNYDKNVDRYEYVYYGVYQYNNHGNDYPIKWRILSTNGNEGTYEDGDGNRVGDMNALFLLSEYTTDLTMAYNGKTANEGQTLPADWRFSDVWKWCNDTTDADSFINYFTDAQKKHFLKTSKAGTAAGSGASDELIGDTFFFLSIPEAGKITRENVSADETGVWRTDSIFGTHNGWWLRGSLDADNTAGAFNGTAIGHNDVDYSYNLRPAFNLNTKNLLFTTPAEGKKINVGTLSANGKNRLGEYELTMKDDTRNFTVTQATSSITKGGTVTFTYENAATGTNEYISAMIVQGGDRVLYYGQLANAASASGEASFTFPSELDYGTYELKLFNEQINGDYLVDYASGFQTVTLKVEEPKATVTTEPTAKTLTYDGTLQALVTAGASTGGTMMYATEENGTYSETVPTAKDADDYTVWYYAKGESGYSDSVKKSVAVTIAPRVVDIMWEQNSTFTYDGTVKEYTAAIMNIVGGDTVNITYSGNKETNASDDFYHAQITAIDNTDYTLTGAQNLVGDWMITPKTVTATIGDIPAQTYMGIELEPTITAYDGTTEISSSEYTVDYSDNVNAGTATVTLRNVNEHGNMGNYIVSGSTTFTINPLPVEIEWTVPYNAIYNRNAYTVTARVANAMSGDTINLTLQNDVKTDKGDYVAQVVALDNDNYTLTNGINLTKDWSIMAKDIWGAEITLGTPLTYNGNEQTQTVAKVEIDGLTLSDSEYTVWGNIETDANTYTLFANGEGNFTGFMEQSFTIAKLPVEIEWSADGFKYDGTPKTITASVKNSVGTDVVNLTTDGTFTATDVGDYTAKVIDVDNGNYTVANGVNLVKRWSIGKSDSETTVSANTTVTYGESLTITANVAKKAGLVSLMANEDEVEFYVGEGGTKTLLGTASVTYTDAEKDEGTATLTIDTVDKQLSVGANKISAEYGGSVSLNGSGSSAITVTLNKKTLGITWINHENLVYDGQPKNVGAIATGIEDGDGEITVSVSCGDETNAASYTAMLESIKGTNAKYYDLPNTYSEIIYVYTINPLPVEIEWTVPTDAIYNRNAYTVTAQVANAISGDTINLTLENDVKTDKGDYVAQVVAVDNDNYTLTGGKDLTKDWSIAAKDISGAQITLGTPLTYNGNAQTQTVAKVEIDGLTLVDAEYTLSDNVETDADTYTLTVSGEGNFTGTQTEDFTIEKLPVVIEWSGTDGLVYNGEPKTITASVANRKGTDVINLTTDGTFTATDADDYTAKVIDVDNTNYTVTNGENLTKDWAISQTDDNEITNLAIVGWTYGDAPNAPTADAKYGEPTYTYASEDDDVYTATVPENAGTYRVKATVAGTKDYAETTSAPVTFTIAKADLVPGTNFTAPTAVDGLVYNGKNQALVNKAQNLPDGCTAWYLGGVPGDDWTDTESVSSDGTQGYAVACDAQDYIVKWYIEGNDNYNDYASKTAPEELTVTIAPKPVTATVTVVGTYIYTASAIVPDAANVTVKDGEKTVPSSEYTFTCTDNVDVGTATITLIDTDGGNYTVDGEGTFTIEPKSIDGATVTLENTLTYNGSEQTQNVVVTLDGYDNVTFDVDDNKATNVNTKGDYTLTVTAKGNFVGEKTLDWNILPAAPTENVKTTARILKNIELTYATVTYGEMAGVDGKALEGSFEWVDDSVKLSADSTQQMIFTPNDTNYKAIKFDVEVTTFASSSGSFVAARYTVKFDTDGGSKIANQTVTNNKKATRPAKPTKDGYIFDDWYADKGLTVRYDFASPITADITLYAKWDKDEVQIPTTEAEWENPFTDVAKDDWFYENIKFAHQNGLMNGVEKTLFAPNDTLTRTMLVTVLWRLEGQPSVDYALPFTDIDENEYYAEALRWAASEKIVLGVSETEFAPDENITREQIATIIYRYAKYKGYDVSVGEDTNILSYTDFDEISEYAIEAMQYAVGSGLIKGKTESTLNPLDNATRAEIAAILQRFIAAN